MIYTHVWGEYGCFTNPFDKVERYSYPVITPSAARGILEHVLYKPEFRWEVRKIAVLSPIEYHAPFRKNEIKKKITLSSISSAMKKGIAPECINIQDERTQRVTVPLKKVEYIIGAEIVDVKGDREDTTYQKYIGMATRYLEQGKCFGQPYFGQKEFICNFELASQDDMTKAIGKNKDRKLGLMVYDNFNLDTKEQFTSVYAAELINGIINVPTWRQVSDMYHL